VDLTRIIPRLQRLALPLFAGLTLAALLLACNRTDPPPQPAPDLTATTRDAVTAPPPDLTTPDTRPPTAPDLIAVARDAVTTPTPDLTADTATRPASPLEALPTEEAPLPIEPELEALFQCAAREADKATPTLRKAIRLRLAALVADRDTQRTLALLDGADHGDLLCPALTRLAARDPRAAATFAAAIDDRWLRSRCVAEIAASLLDANLEQALLVTFAVSPRVAREKVLMALVEASAPRSWQQADTIANRIYEPLFNDYAVAAVAAGRAAADLAGAMSMVEPIESPFVKEWALGDIVLAVVGNGPDKVSELADQFQRGTGRDDLFCRLARRQAPDSPDAALALVLRIEEEKARRLCLDEVAREILPRKAALARLIAEKNRQPRLPPHLWYEWVRQACQHHPEAAPKVLEELLRGARPEQVSATLEACCPGAPAATRSAASSREIHDPGLTRCFVCAGILPDPLATARAMRNPRERDEALACAIPNRTTAPFAELLAALKSIRSSTLRDQTAANLAARWPDAGEASKLPETIASPYLQAATLVTLLERNLLLEKPDPDETLRLLTGVTERLPSLADSWRQDDLRARLARALAATDRTRAWQIAGTIRNTALLHAVLADLLPPDPHSCDTQALANLLPEGLPRATGCLGLAGRLLERPPTDREEDNP
jgi:hypothetical protein